MGRGKEVILPAPQLSMLHLTAAVWAKAAAWHSSSSSSADNAGARDPSTHASKRTRVG